MATEDMRRGWYLGTSSPNQLDQSRRREYKSLISQIRPDLRVVTNGYSGVVRFIFAGEGVAIGPGWVKGIEYVPPEADPKRQGHDYVREIEPNWFIFYDRFDD